MTFITTRSLVFSCLLFIAFNVSANASPEYLLKSTLSDDTQEITSNFFARKEMPSELTRVAYKADIQIIGDQVVEKIKTIWFYPKQTDVENDGNGAVYWDKEVEKLTIHQAGVIDATGSYQRIDRNNARIVNDDSYNIFTDSKKVILPYSGLSAGDVSVLEYELSYPLSKLESNWSFSLYPVSNSDTLSFSLKARSDSIRLNWAVSGERVECSGSESEVSCFGDALLGYKPDSGVIWRDVIDQVYLSESFSWSEVIDTSLAAFNKAELESPEVDKLFARLTSSADSLDQKIQRIHGYVSRDIRYLSLSEIGHRITPHTVASVDKNRFGDCKDKTAALVALLRKLGLKAYPVLIATTRKDPARLKTPSGRYFDHMIACFEYEGKQYCVDATDADTHWSAISSWIQGRVMLPLQSGAEPARLTSQSPRWLMNSKINLIFGDKAQQIETQQRTYRASYAGDTRSWLRSKSDAGRSEALVKQYQDTVSNSVGPDFSFQNIDSLGASLEIESATEYEPFLAVDKDLNYTERDHWLRYELKNSKLSSQYYDSEFEGLEVESRIEVDTSALWKLKRLPASLSLEGQFGSMTRKVEQLGQGKLSVVTVLRVPRQFVNSDEIEMFNNFFDLLISESSINMQGSLVVESTE